MKFYRQLGLIKAMTFDLDDTLYDNRPIIRHVEQQMVTWLFTHHPVAQTKPISWWQDLKRQIALDDPWLPNDVTKWRFTQIEQGLAQLGYSAEQATQAARSAIEQLHLLRSDFVVPQQSHDVLARLADKIPLVAITNGNVDVEKIGLAKYFSLVLKAGPNGYAKPHSDMFSQAQRFLAIDAQEILHVGDHLISDVQGAVNSGFKACWFNDQHETISDANKAKTLPDVEITSTKQLLDLID
jgi:putative hydrolase of the HAD superfamily